MYTFYGQWNPPVDKEIFELYFPDHKKGTAIECGAYDGVKDSCCYFFEKNFDWTVYNIEPVPNNYNKLVVNRPDSKNYNIALSDKNSEEIFRQYVDFNKRDFGNGSLKHHENHVKELEKNGCTYYDFNVKTKTYSDFIKDENIEKIDLFVLDVEGHEPDVIKGMIGCDILPDVFIIEHGHLGVDILKESLKELKSRYILDKQSFNNSFFVKEEFKD